MNRHVGDTAPALSGKVSANLTGATARVHIQRPQGGTVIDEPATIAPGTDGAFSYAFKDGDLDTAGVWTVELEVKFSDGSTQTFGPDLFLVDPQLA